MLLSSIVQTLRQHSAQPKAVEQKNAEGDEFRVDQPLEEGRGLKQREMEVAAAAGLLRPLSTMPDPIIPPQVGPSPDQFIRTVSKLEEAEEIRVVDVFK